MRTQDLDYDLPPDLIATHAVEPRDAARLMVVRRTTGQVEHHHVRDLPALGVLRPGDLMVVNQTRVLPAAFEATRAQTGGRVKGLYLPAQQATGDWHIMLEARGTLQPGERLVLDDQAALELVERIGGGEWRARLLGDGDALAVLSRVGATPLPPYIQKARRSQHESAIQPEDVERYNTVYARDAGSVAAPTAGLHFTSELLAKLEEQGVQRAAVTLHVGLGTFVPVRTEQLHEHQMHEEWLHVSSSTLHAIRETRARGGRIFVVGTTTVRALESLPPLGDITGDYATQTRLFIHPEANCQFRFTDMLMTNFHLPRSTLLAMVASLPGASLEQLKQWYAQAIAERYRFYSYGDAMLLA